MIKDIAVHLTGSDEDKIRLNAAESIAGMFNAHLTGLLMHVEPDFLPVPDPNVAAALQSWTDEAEAVTRKRKADLDHRFSIMAVPNDLRIVSGPKGTVGDALAMEARTADLFVGSRPYGDPEKSHRIEEAVLFSSGRACLWLPPMNATSWTFTNVLVAWKNTRESARAVKEALPFLQLAQQVTLIMVTDEPGEEAKTSMGADIARYLSRHGVACEIRELAGWHSASEALMNEVTRSASDLVVAGAYGHARLQQRLLGGVTRTFLSSCEVPVLMAR